MEKGIFASAFIRSVAMLCPKLAFCYIVCNIIMIPAALAQLIPCDGTHYLFLVPSNNPNTSMMYRVSTNAITGAPNYELINPNMGRRITAAGYSVWQQQIYALDYNTKELLKIDAKGNVIAYPVPIYLDTLYDYFAGEVTPSGGNLLVVGRDKKTSKDLTMFSIRLYENNHIAGRVSILSDFATNLEDLAFDPFRGVLYGYDAKTNKITWVDGFSGKVNDYFSRAMQGVSTFGSLFFDRLGFLHAYGATSGSEESAFFDVNKLHGELQKTTSGGPSGLYSDGCGCPYTVQSFKQVTPAQVLPCTEFTVTYDIVNHAGTAYSYVSLEDTFPSGFMITNIIKMPITGMISSGIGSNVLSVQSFDLLLDTNRVIITVEAPNDIQPGTYASQAVLKELPLALGGKIYSDDPQTLRLQDSTSIEVIGNYNLKNVIHQRPLCNEKGIALETDLKNVIFKWGTGDTNAKMIATTPGWYTFTITSDCNIFTDSLYIDAIPEPLQIKLIPVTPVELGDLLNLSPKVNTHRSLQYAWQASDGAAIDCSTCATLTATPLQNTTYTLTATDAFGCQARDSVAVEVIPVRHIFAPTAFSPNNDGVNDIFYLQGKINTRIIYLRIFDRWGNQVFQVQNGILNDPNFGWNGSVQSKFVPSQSFVYLAEIEFPDGVKKQISGEVALLR